MNEKKNLTIEETYALAVKNHQKNNLQIAENLYKEALKTNPNHFESIYYLGTLLAHKKKFDLAKLLFHKAIQIEPNYAVVHYNLGIVLQELGENQKAISSYEKAIQIEPNYAKAHYNLGKVLQDLGENQKAISSYKKAITIQPNYAVAHNNLGIVLQELGENQKAISSYKKAITIQPDYATAHNNLGNIQRELGEHQKAISSYQKAIKIQPNYAVAHNNLGNVFQVLDDHQKAISSYQKAIKIQPNYAVAHNNLGNVFQVLDDHQKAIACYQEALKLKSDFVDAQANISNIYISQLDDSEKAISESYKTLKMNHEASKFINQRISLYRLKHDVQQAKYLSSKNYKINGIDKFQKIGNEILSRKENREDDNNFNKKILLNQDEINALLPFYKENHVYQTSKISGSCINLHKNWQDVEEQYLNSPKQIIYIDNFLSDEAIKELREFCLVSKIWNREYENKYLGSFADSGFISPIHLQIAIDLKQKLPKLFGQHKLGKFWAFKYDSTIGKGINVHADFAIHNLNFWITPDEYNNNKNSGGLKVYDAPAPENWTFQQYNRKKDEIYKFLNDNNANSTNVPYKFNRAVLFNSAYFHETDKINFKDKYEARRINITYLFGNRLVKKKN